jgi:LmbE family N-acetylglucosaminyl deacetylase
MNISRLLIIAPHTDDAELGCGGTIARCLEEGTNVHVAAFSTADESLPAGFRNGTLKKEFLQSMHMLGVPEENAYVYGHPVRKLSEHRQEVLDALIRLRSAIDPDMVLIPSGADLHQDHQVLHDEGLRAFKDRTLWGYELPWNHITFSAQAFVVLEGRHLEAKWCALTCYQSQISQNRPYFKTEFIQGLARVRGTQVRAEFAEAYEVMRVKI